MAYYGLLDVLLTAYCRDGVLSDQAVHAKGMGAPAGRRTRHATNHTK